MRRFAVLAAWVLTLGVAGAGLVPVTPATAQQTTESPGLCDTAAVEQFSDVADGDYGAAYVLCMRTLGLSAGFAGGVYGPDRELNRAQMATFLVQLWRLLGNQCPTGVTSPFTDVVAGSTHAEDIDCIYALGITAGTTATTYGPQDSLKASHITLFLYRTYQKTGNTACDSLTGSSLERATACLLQLQVTPTQAEATSSTPVTRAQMGVYVIGLWHNLSGKGPPPPPPPLGAPTPVAATTTTQPAPAASQCLVFQTYSGRELRVWAFDGTDPVTIATVDSTVDADDIYGPRLSPDGKTISYNLNESLELWVVGVDGSNSAKISDLSHHYVWSPDGRRLWYSDFSTGELWVADADGSNNTKLAGRVEGYSYARDPGWAFWSPDGTRIAYEGRGDNGFNSQLWVVDADGSNKTKVADGVDRYMRWSPDGSRMAYTTGSDTLWIADADGSDSRQLVDTLRSYKWEWGDRSQRSYYWARDGSRIVYIPVRDARTMRYGYELWVVDVDGSNNTKLANNIDRWYAYGGSHIAFLTTSVWQKDGLWQKEGLWVVDLDGGNTSKLADYANWEWWSPDGTRIAYTAGRQDKEGWDEEELWMVDTDGSNKTKVADGVEHMAGWSPSGSHFFYESDHKYKMNVILSDLYRVDVENARTTKVLDDKYRFHWSSDGSLISYGNPIFNDTGLVRTDHWVLDTANHHKQMISRGWSRPIWLSSC